MTTTTADGLAERFEEHRAHLRSVAYRMLGSLGEAEDAVQESWLRLSRADVAEVGNLGGWLTTVVSRICLDLLRGRQARREELIAQLPDPLLRDESASPEASAVQADAVGLAMQVVLDTLNPAERVAFVLHDLFAVPFDRIAPILGRGADATKMLASRARRRVRDSRPAPERDLTRQREAVNAFLAAAKGGDLEALLAVLDPEVVLRSDQGSGLQLVQGAKAVASGAKLFRQSRPDVEVRPMLVNDSAAIVSLLDGEVHAILAFTVSAGRIVEIDVLGDRARLARLGITP